MEASKYTRILRNHVDKQQQCAMSTFTLWIKGAKREASGGIFALWYDTHHGELSSPTQLRLKKMFRHTKS